MSSTSPKLFKQLEKEVAKESKTEEQRLKQAMKELSVTEKQQAKAHKAVLKAENKLAKVNKKESTANAAMVKATQKHDTTATSVQHAEQKLQARKDADMKLQQDIDAKKAQIQTALRSQKNNEAGRNQQLREIKSTPGVAGGETAAVPGHSTGFATAPAEQAGQGGSTSAAGGQTRNFAAEQPMSNTNESPGSVPQSTNDSGPGMTAGSAPHNANFAPAQGTSTMEARDNSQGAHFGAHGPNHGLRSGQNLPAHDSNSGIRDGQNLSTRLQGIQGQGYPNEPQAMHVQNLAASQANPTHIDQGDDMSKLRGQANPIQSSPLATHEPISNIGGNPSGYGAGLGQPHSTQNTRNVPGSGSVREPMRQTEGTSSSGNRGSGPTSSHYGTPPENPGGMQGAREANLAGIGAGGTAPSANASTVPAGGVTHPVTGDTVGVPHAGMDNMARTGEHSHGVGGVGDGSGRFLNVPGGQSNATSDIVDRALAGDTKVGSGGM